jgi:hypothetical protein
MAHIPQRGRSIALVIEESVEVQGHPKKVVLLVCKMKFKRINIP